MLKHCQFHMVQKVGCGGIQMEGIERAESTGLGKEAGGWEWLLGIQMVFEKKIFCLVNLMIYVLQQLNKCGAELFYPWKTSEIPKGVKKFVGEERPFYFIFLINQNFKKTKQVLYGQTRE